MHVLCVQDVFVCYWILIIEEFALSFQMIDRSKFTLL